MEIVYIIFNTNISHVLFEHTYVKMLEEYICCFSEIIAFIWPLYSHPINQNLVKKSPSFKKN